MIGYPQFIASFLSWVNPIAIESADAAHILVII
jgi:hypothetical protein